MSRPLAVVTGASRGIGAASAAALGAAGFQVVRLARSLSDSKAGTAPGADRDFRCDITIAGEVERVAQEILRLGTPDLVVSNAGAFVMKRLQQLSVQEFTEQVALNLTGAFAVARAFLPAMQAAGRGTFVTIGSVADHVGFPGNAAYGASKFGVRGLHEALAAECADTGVRCTLVSPGPTDTDVWKGVTAGPRETLPAREQMLRAQDVAEAVVFAATRPARVRIEWIRMELIR
ncbi:MAG: SDR family oxidoreductase [Gemmatimonadales bacterium]